MDKTIIPNLFTLTNLLCGCIAIVCILQDWLGTAFAFYVVGLLADFGDGLVARALKASSEIGKQLDSLADMVTFGVVPGTILFHLLAQGFYGQGTLVYFPWLALPGFLFTGFAGYRLGKFNVDTRQTDEFRGLATPAASLFVTGLMMAQWQDATGWTDFLTQPISLYLITLVLGGLMVSDLRMFSFKVKGYGWKGNELRYVFLALSLLGIVVLGYLGLSLAIVWYVCFSLFFLRTR